VGAPGDQQRAYEAITKSDKLVIINSVCDDLGEEALIQPYGFVRVGEPQVTQPKKPAFGTVWTDVQLWVRNARRTPNSPSPSAPT
jgi:hypothetical protein